MQVYIVSLCLWLYVLKKILFYPFAEFLIDLP